VILELELNRGRDIGCSVGFGENGRSPEEGNWCGFDSGGALEYGPQKVEGDKS